MYRFYEIQKKQGLKSCNVKRNLILEISGLPYIFKVENLQYYLHFK